MQVIKIICDYKEYRLQDNKNWILTATNKSYVDSGFINNIINSCVYFSNMGGYMARDFKHNRRFGLVCSKIVSVSFCGKVKKIMVFNYNQAQEIS